MGPVRQNPIQRTVRTAHLYSIVNCLNALNHMHLRNERDASSRICNLFLSPIWWSAAAFNGCKNVYILVKVLHSITVVSVRGSGKAQRLNDDDDSDSGSSTVGIRQIAREHGNASCRCRPHGNIQRRVTFTQPTPSLFLSLSVCLSLRSATLL